MVGGQQPALDARPTTQQVAADVQHLVEVGHLAAAHERFGLIVEALQRRANRLAVSYLRNVADADEAVQDAFVKAYLHIGSYNPAMSFDVWFLRILVNGCLDRMKARTRRFRWMAEWGGDTGPSGLPVELDPPSNDPTPEQTLLRGEQREALEQAIATLPDRQRTVVLLSQLDGRTTKEVSAVTGLNESTVRVHLFRALRRLRSVLGPTAEGRTRGA